ncbi:MAG: hypothetical protein DKT66_04790 [Candidatus Melainabacteria bacterium]|nr:MAG: hypothetical protein DKT66_04790 [Candidatus Melainabacteria bacterium]
MALRKTRIAIVLCAIIGIASIAGLIDYLRYDSIAPSAQSSFNSAKNGIWLRYLWYAGKHSPTEFANMYKQLATSQMRYAYFHVLTTKSDGRLKLRNEQGAKALTKGVKKNAPNTRAIAWVYVGSVEVDLDNPKVRKALVDEFRWLVDECGFDGVQVDYEFALNGAQGLLRLLEEARQGLPKDRLLSVATPMWYPGILWGWSDDYFQEVAKRCDQIAVMSYDSYLYIPRVYVWLVAQQAIHITADCAKANPACKVILGLPTYDNQTLSHHPYSESLKNALRGVQIGLADKNAKPDAFEGIAMFADYTTDDREWGQYEEYWLGKKRSKELPL